MALPSSGAISLNQVNVELGNSGTAYINLNDAVVRALFGKASGAISMSDGHGKSNAFSATRAVFNYNLDLEYVTIATTGNSINFGDLSASITELSACASESRGVWAGGYLYPDNKNVIDYITIATTGNSTDFGDLTMNRKLLAGCSSGTRGVFGGGAAPSVTATIDYITIATTGNASSFGNLTLARSSFGACANTIRGVWGGGAISPGGDTMDYITIASTGNATDFGNLTTARGYLTSCASATRGIFAGGLRTDGSGTNFNIIDYITIASTGNATDFGDLSGSRNQVGSAASATRGIFAGGYSSPLSYNIIEYITIATTGNATDFGDLLAAKRAMMGCAGS